MDGVYDENAGAIFVLTGILVHQCTRPSGLLKLFKTDPVSFVSRLFQRLPELKPLNQSKCLTRLNNARIRHRIRSFNTKETTVVL